MADKYVSSTGPLGSGNGSSEANAWSLTNAFSNAVAGDYVWIKNDGTYTGIYTVNCSGSYTANTHIYFIGYNNIANCDLTNHISDMDMGQPYWGGPLNPSFANGWCDIDGGGATNYILYASYKSNLHFRNMYFHNVASGFQRIWLYFCKNITFTKCKFEYSGNYGIFTDYSDGIGVAYCYFTGDYGGIYTTYGESCLVHHNYFNGGITAGGFGSGVFANNVCANATQGMVAYKRNMVVCNNIFYNIATESIFYGHSSMLGSVFEYNNIFMPADKATAIFNKYNNGSIIYSGYSCAWALSNGGEAMTTPYAGEHGLNVDPLLVDPANGDFRSRNPAVINGGKPDADGNPSQMGAVRRKYRFAAGGRMTNRARLQIIR